MTIDENQLHELERLAWRLLLNTTKHDIDRGAYHSEDHVRD